MRTIFFFPVMLASLFWGCKTQQTAAYSGKDPGVTKEIPAPPDSVIYDLIVPEIGFDNWFATNRKPLWYHPAEYYRYWNYMYSQEWNSRCIHQAYREPYSYRIEYDYNTDYGVDLNYKLYYFFKYIEHRYGERFFFTSGAL